MSGEAGTVLSKAKIYEPDFMGVSFSQIAHFFLFYILSLVISFTLRSKKYLHTIVYLLLFAAVTETLQNYIPNREPTLNDWLFDAAGVFLAFFTVWVYQKIRT
jgi:VanZ family protein